MTDLTAELSERITAQCKACRYWVRNWTEPGGFRDYGSCRRFPPTDNRKLEIKTGLTYWCGEWQAAQSPEEKPT